jgi:hypothetical protein
MGSEAMQHGILPVATGLWIPQVEMLRVCVPIIAFCGVRFQRRLLTCGVDHCVHWEKTEVLQEKTEVLLNKRCKWQDMSG